MTCPDCRGELRKRRIAGIDIDRCEGCGGVWLDAGELESYRRARSGHDSASCVFTPHTGVDSGACPACGSGTLDSGTLDARELRRCSSCSGVFVNAEILRTFEDSTARALGEVAVDFAGHAAVDVLDWVAELF